MQNLKPQLRTTVARNGETTLRARNQFGPVDSGAALELLDGLDDAKHEIPADERMPDSTFKPQTCKKLDCQSYLI